MQFVKFVVINKGTNPWTKTYFSIVSAPEIGSPDDDYIGCDTVTKLGFRYNGDNDDPIYGVAPPAVGFLLLKGAYNKYANPQKQLDMTSLDYFVNSQPPPPPCEVQPYGDPMGAYHFMQGYKRDSTCWLDPTQLIYPPNFYKKTKFVYPGNPETNTGWTNSLLTIGNCGHDSSGNPQSSSGNSRLVLSSGEESLTVMPGDTQTIIISQLLGRGASNKNSVTKLKQSAVSARLFYNSGFTIGINKISSEVPTRFRLEQNYPNPFNPTTKIKFDIAAKSVGQTFLSVFDITGRELQTLVNEKLNPGIFEVTFDGSNFASGVYFYQLRNGDYVETRSMILLK
jgi:hypothetical protein